MNRAPFLLSSYRLIDCSIGPSFGQLFDRLIDWLSYWKVFDPCRFCSVFSVGSCWEFCFRITLGYNPVRCCIECRIAGRRRLCADGRRFHRLPRRCSFGTPLVAIISRVENPLHSGSKTDCEHRKDERRGVRLSRSGLVPTPTVPAGWKVHRPLEWSPLRMRSVHRKGRVWVEESDGSYGSFVCGMALPQWRDSRVQRVFQWGNEPYHTDLCVCWGILRRFVSETGRDQNSFIVLFQFFFQKFFRKQIIWLKFCRCSDWSIDRLIGWLVGCPLRSNSLILTDVRRMWPKPRLRLTIWPSFSE